MTLFLVGTATVLGLAVGSFLNVVIHRVPKHESIVRPPSRCPSCGHDIRPRDNVPVVSWLLLRGRCRDCGAPIAARYPAVEVATGALFAAAAVRFGADWALPAFAVFFAALLAVAVIDLDLFIIPNRIVYPALVAAIPLLSIPAVIDGDVDRLARAAAGGLLAWIGLLVVHLISPRGMGFGDVRLAAVIGVYTGWISLLHVLLAIFLGFASASVVGVVLLASGRKGRKDPVPFGPFLALGAVSAVLFGVPVLDWWLGGG